MAAALNLTPEERREITMPAATILTRARDFKVVDVTTYTEAADQLKAIKGAQKSLEGKKRTLLDPANAVVKAIRDLFRGPEAELEQAESFYKRGMLGYDAEQERIRREEQARRDEEANRERLRLEAQAREREEAAARSRAAGKTAQAERQEAQAALRQDAAAAVVAPVVQKETPRVAGVATREHWYAVVTDVKALCAAVAAGTVPVNALTPNKSFLDNQARVMKKDLAYPGVTACMDKILASGSR